eukprot:CAMPEP_0197294166 /NCGR_PEP_ID=MMETSP0890-20130614/31303_1 /TAXON_ID=44058 ORGANISM="Aureoumbra lagunensis, Strain CCMP1510" /NCGR_SAMPLE_ID=MMETSP0890 /ASSEMBLY_ACC=CAM_ASM_000533 /LENGTH=350 /DNA_ID=CAMNT_0042769375 /DNA_START=57 /DNA_END=1106 /DNA_ORIENTATION=+
MKNYLNEMMQVSSFEAFVAKSIATRFAGRGFSVSFLAKKFQNAFENAQIKEDNWSLAECIRLDADAVAKRDPACDSILEVILYFKGFAAITAHRIARSSWFQGERQFALWLQSRASELCGVDIHPCATISAAVMCDHATGIVIGETAVVGYGVTMLHNVTLGATGKEKGDRHPKIGQYVLLGANVSILGNISIGSGAKIGAGSVVLRDIPANATAVGAPARIIGRAKEEKPSIELDNGLTNYIPSKNVQPDAFCVWREITKFAQPQAAHLSLYTFVSALAVHGVPQNQAQDLFFQLDQDQDGLVNETDIINNFPTKAKNSCESCHCPEKSKAVAKSLHEAIKKAALSPSW